MMYTVVVGEQERHAVEVSYQPLLGRLRVRMDGRTVHASWRLLPGQRRRGIEFRTPGEELHFLVLEPVPAPDAERRRRPVFRLWLDGRPIATVDES